MWLMMQQENPSDYVLASGKTYTVRLFVEKVFEKLGMIIKWRGSGIDEEGIDQNGNVRIKIDAKYFRPCEVELLLGDSSLAEEKLGWKREFDFEDLIDDMIESDTSIYKS